MLNEKKKNKIILLVCIAVVVLLVWFIFIGPYVTFKSREKEVLNGAKRYYEINASKLPTGTKVATLSLKTLYDKDFVDSSPNSVYATNKCNIDKSFVKVRKENGEYKYYVYLECGLLKSDVDHEGPTIKLKGDEEITLSRGDKYEELGVESVKDNTDGVMDVKKVTIDSSKVNTTRNGTYEATYKIKDSFNNETVKVRTIKVIQTLNNIVKKEAGGDTYQGTHEDGYIKIDEILFKIVGINDDGSVKVVSNDALAAVDFDGVNTWLDDYFYDKLSDNIKKYIVKSKWCDESVSNPENTTKCGKYGKKRNVGLLSVSDINNSKDSENNYYLNSQGEMWTYNTKSKNQAISYTNSKFTDQKTSEMLLIYPTLNIKKDTYISKGTGSADNPYVIRGTTKSAKVGDLISEAKVGAYINYSSYLWRVIGKEKDGTTKVIMDDIVKMGNESFYTRFSNGSKATFDTSQEGNLGYALVNNASNYVKTSLFISEKREILNYTNGIGYKKDTDKKTYNSKLTLPSMYDLFSTTIDNDYWYANYSNKANRYCYMHYSGSVFCSEYDITEQKGIRISANLKKDISIKSGSGTIASPYILAS